MERKAQTLLSLDGTDWVIARLHKNDQHPQIDGLSAHVPGVVHMDLLRHGIIDEPYKGYNELEYKWIYKSDWQYRKKFVVSSEFKNKHEKIVLQIDGIDTIGILLLNFLLQKATIKINNKTIGKTENMFRGYIFQVAEELIVTGENTIEITIHNAPEYAKSRGEKHAYKVPASVYPNSEPFPNFVRKCGCHWLIIYYLFF